MSSHLLYRNQAQENQSSFGLVYQVPGENVGRPLPELLFRGSQQCRFHHTFAYMLKATLGVGILVLPYTFRVLGIIGAIFCLLVAGISVSYCMDNVIGALQMITLRMNKQAVSYNYAYKLILYNGSERARWFSYWAEYAIDFFVVASQIGVCSVHLAFTSAISHEILGDYFPVDFLWHVLIQSIIYLIMIITIRLFHTLFYISIVGNCLAILGLILIIANTAMEFSPKEIQLFGEDLYYNLPICYAIHLFAFVSIGVVTTIATRDQTLIKRGGALKLNHICMIIIYILIGSIGYLSFGANVQPIFLNNLHPSIFKTCTVSIYTLSIAISMPLQTYPVTDCFMEYFYRTYGISDNTQKTACDKNNILRIIVQICIVLFCAQTIMLLKNLELLISLTGTIFITPVCIITPCIMKCIGLYPASPGKHQFIRIIIWNMLLILLGFYVVCLSTVYNVNTLLVPT